MSPSKEVIIINWDYRRKDLSKHLAKFKELYEVVFLYYYNDKVTEDGVKVINWTDYLSPQSILHKLKPVGIIFHDIESFHQIGLNIAAKRDGIKTFVLEHGLRGGFEVDIANYDKPKSILPSNSRSSQTILFLILTIRSLNVTKWHKYLKLVYLRKKYGLTKGLSLAKYDFRLADLYINFTKLNATYIMKRDGVPNEKIVCIGNPQFDEYFNKKTNKNNCLKRENYILLLDAPFEVDPAFEMKLEDKINFYNKLKFFCEGKSLKLKVKLHPRSSIGNINVSGIDFETDEDPLSLINGAIGCVFIHFSGLLPLALISSKVIFFNTFSVYNEEILKLDILKAYDFYNFNINELEFTKLEDNERQIIIDKYFYKIDGNAGERMINLVENHLSTSKFKR